MRALLLWVVGVAGTCAIAAPALGVAGLEFRVVERTGQTLVDGADNVLDYAIQVRVTGATNLYYGGGGLTAQMPGEAESAGALARGSISNSDATYFPGVGVGVPGTVSGIAAPYRYLVNLNTSFNGVINANNGPVSHNPAYQDIISISPFPGGSALLATPGLFGTDENTGDLIPPPGGVPPAAIGNAYFGGNGNFIDLYRFRYTVSDLTTPRTIPVTVALNEQRLFSQLSLVDNVWGAMLGDALSPSALSITPASFTVVPAPGCAFVCGALGLAATRRRRR